MTELLAPVGGMPQLEAAINNGADAVYMGGPLFNARIKAENFTNEDLQTAIDYAHERNVKVYITFNTLIKDSELSKAFEYACFLYEAGVDAIIIQDMGLAHMIHKHLPDFPMHLSTQGTVYNIHALELIKQLGFKRVVPARELTLDEIRRMCSVAHSATSVAMVQDMLDASDMPAGLVTPDAYTAHGAHTSSNLCNRKQTSDLEVEVFVHGALCMCYSGQCQMSRLLGAKSAGALSNLGNLSDRSPTGQNNKLSDDHSEKLPNNHFDKIPCGHLDKLPSARSGNRGLCAQPCRLPYTDDKDRIGFWLSPKDICTIEKIPELISAGVDSFKIEGRLKSPEYVATVTRIYRKYIDLYMELCREEKASTVSTSWKIAPEDMHDLMQIFNRGGFTTGYLDGNPGRNILSGDSPKNQGIYVGTVCSKPKEIRGNAGTKNKMLIDVKLANQTDKSKQFHDDSDGFHGKTKNSSEAQISLGDGVEIRARKRDDFYRANNMTSLFTTGNIVTYLKSLGGDKIRIGDFDKGIHEGDKVYKVTDKKLNAKALKSPAKKLPVAMKFEAEIDEKPMLEIREIIPSKSDGCTMYFEYSGIPFESDCLPVEGGGVSSENNGMAGEGSYMHSDVVKVSGDFVTQKALNKPTDSERIREQISKLGDTPFKAINVQINVGDEIMIPVSVINQMRRDAVKKLLNNKHVRRSLGVVTRAKATFEDFVNIAHANTTCEDFAYTTCEGFAEGDRKGLVENKKTFVPLKQFMKELDLMTSDSISYNESVLPYILNVSRGELDKYIEENFDAIVNAVRATGIAIGNLGWIKQFLDAGVKVYGDYGLNAYNSECVRAYEELGVRMIRMSHEMSGDGIDGMAGNMKCADERFGGRIPLMITEHPLETNYLIDRKGVKHDVIHLGDKHLLF